MQQFHDIFFTPGSVESIQVDYILGRVKFLFAEEQEEPGGATATTKIPLEWLPEALHALQHNEDWGVPGVTANATAKSPLPHSPKFKLNQCVMLRNIYQQWLMGQIRAIVPGSNSYQIDVPGFGKLWTRTEKELLPICNPRLLRTHDKVVLCDGDFKTTIYVEGQIEFLDVEADHCIIKRLDGSRPYEGSLDEIVAKLPSPPSR